MSDHERIVDAVSLIDGFQADEPQATSEDNTDLKRAIEALQVLNAGRAVKVSMGDAAISGLLLPAVQEDRAITVFSDDADGKPRAEVLIILDNGDVAITYFQVTAFYQKNVSNSQLFIGEPLTATAEPGSDAISAVVAAFPSSEYFRVFRPDSEANVVAIQEGLFRAVRQSPPSEEAIPQVSFQLGIIAMHFADLTPGVS